MQTIQRQAALVWNGTARNPKGLYEGKGLGTRTLKVRFHHLLASQEWFRLFHTINVKPRASITQNEQPQAARMPAWGPGLLIAPETFTESGGI